eukprot:2393304-Rhodomonas_salina.1
MGAQYQPIETGLIPLDSVRAGKGTFLADLAPPASGPLQTGDFTHVCDGYFTASNVGVTGYTVNYTVNKTSKPTPDPAPSFWPGSCSAALEEWSKTRRLLTTVVCVCVCVCVCSLHDPQTLEPGAWSLDPKPKTRDPKPKTQDPNPYPIPCALYPRP